MQVRDDGPGTGLTGAEVDALFAPFYADLTGVGGGSDDPIQRQLDAERRAVAAKLREGCVSLCVSLCVC